MDQQQAHAEKMNMDHQQAEIKSANKKIKKMQKMQERTIVDIRVAKEKEDQLQENYLRHKAKHEEDLAVIVKKIELAQLKYAESNDKIRDVINRTNLDEGSIPQFLNLINDGLIVGTLNDTAKREELNSLLNANIIGALVGSTSLSIDMKFKGRLEGFVKYLKAENYTEMDDILCDDSAEFNGVLQLIEKGIERENKEIEQENEDLDRNTEKITEKNAKIEEKVAAIDKQIGEINEEIIRLKEERAKEEQDGAKGKEITKELGVQEELLKQKNEQRKEQLDQKAKPPQRRDLIAPIRTKKTQPGPVVKKLKKLCMRELAEGKRGWITKADDSDTEVDIDMYFKGKLAPFAKYLKNEGYDAMEDILCDDEDEFEMILDIIEAGIAEDKGKPLKKGTSGKESVAYRCLEKMCLRKNAGAKDGWISEQKKKKKVVTAQLNEVSPLLATFFGEIDAAVNEARKYLEYSPQRTHAQKLAIKNAESNKKKLKALELKSSGKEGMDYDEKEALDALDDINSILATYPEHLDEKQNALDVRRKENAAFITAAIVKLHVVDDALAHKFMEGDQLKIRRTALKLAKDVVTCSLQIIQSHATIRSSLLIARQLIEFRPVKPGPKAAKFWEVIDKGIINIFNNYIEMMKIASQFFAFFLKFKAGFEYYMSCHEIKGDEVNLVVATQYIQSDVKAFTAFTSKMQATVDKLTDDAKTVIHDCVSQTSGACSFRKAQEQREEAQEELLKQQKILNDAQVQLETAVNEVHDAWKQQAADVVRLESVKQQQHEKIEHLKQNVEKANEKVLEPLAR